jgi:hypothetical protein
MRISWVKLSSKETSYNHPTLGGLPLPWILHLVKNSEGGLFPKYFNRNNGVETTHDP